MKPYIPAVGQSDSKSGGSESKSRESESKFRKGGTDPRKGECNSRKGKSESRMHGSESRWNEWNLRICKSKSREIQMNIETVNLSREEVMLILGKVYLGQVEYS